MSDRICLIVDDEPVIRTYLRAILEREGIQSLEADNAIQALKIVHKLGGGLDLIITEIKMHGEIDGLDLALAMKNTYANLPVILISGYADEDRRKSADFECIHKPFVPETIVTAIRRAMTSGAKRAGGA